MKPRAATKTPLDDKDLWETPWEVVGAVKKRVGMPVVLDVCATAETAKAVPFFGPGGICQDAFDVSWGRIMDEEYVSGVQLGYAGTGMAWMNPPYSRGNLNRWTRRAKEFAQSGYFIACLVPHAPDTTWWQENIEPQASLILMPTKRIRFLRPDGTPGDSPPGPSAICLLTPWGGPTVYERLEI